jgi:hypothetical protein
VDDDDPDTDETLPRHDSANRRARVRTDPGGVPAFEIDDSTALSRRIADALEPPGSGERAAPEPLRLEQRVSALEAHGLIGERQRRRVRRWLIAACISAGASIGTVMIWAFNGARAAGAGAERLRYLEHEVETLKLYIFPPPRRAAQPDTSKEPDHAP